jgi:hypothetical protein
MPGAPPPYASPADMPRGIPLTVTTCDRDERGFRSDLAHAWPRPTATLHRLLPPLLFLSGFPNAMHHNFALVTCIRGYTKFST